MANENPNPVTYADWAKTRDPDGSTADIVEVLEKMNPIIKDAAVRMGNMTEGHRTTVRTGIPRGTWRQLNYGVIPTKAASKQVTDTPGMLEAFNEVDESLLNLEDDKAAFMLSESEAQLHGMSLDHAETLFYGNTALNPERFMGLTPRYNDAAAESARNIVNGDVGGGGVGSTNHSMWFVNWGMQSAFEFFPKGSKVGLNMEPLGRDVGHDANGGRLMIHRVHFKHDVGFVLRDWRTCARIANIDATAVTAGTYPLIKLMLLAYHRLRKRSMGSLVIYCNEAVATYLDVLALDKDNVHLTMREWAGEEVLSFRGMPIRMCESLLDGTEAGVAGLPTDVS